MRIFTAIRHSNNPSLFYGSLWSENFYSALKNLGHEVIESKVDLLPASRFMQISENFNEDELNVRAQLTEKIISEAKAEHTKEKIDFFLSYFYNAHFDPSGFDELRRLGIKSINFYCNSIYQFELVHKIAEKADISWYPEYDAAEKYKKIGAKAIWVQMGANPKIYHPIAVADKIKAACFIGQRYCDRDHLLAAMIRKKIPVEIYGAGWIVKEKNLINTRDLNLKKEYLGRKIKKPGTIDSFVSVLIKRLQHDGLLIGSTRLFSQAIDKIQSRKNIEILQPFAKGYAKNISNTLAQYELCLNFSNVWQDGQRGARLIPHVRLRDFEAPMSRACYLTGHTDEISHFYNVGKEIETYKCKEELIDKSQYFLKNTSEAEKMRNSGYERAIKEHTWEQRFRTLFQKIGNEIK